MTYICEYCDCEYSIDPSRLTFRACCAEMLDRLIDGAEIEWDRRKDAQMEREIEE